MRAKTKTQSELPFPQKCTLHRLQVVMNKPETQPDLKNQEATPTQDIPLYSATKTPEDWTSSDISSHPTSGLPPQHKMAPVNHCTQTLPTSCRGHHTLHKSPYQMPQSKKRSLYALMSHSHPWRSNPKERLKASWMWNISIAMSYLCPSAQRYSRRECSLKRQSEATISSHINSYNY